MPPIGVLLVAAAVVAVLLIAKALLWCQVFGHELVRGDERIYTEPNDPEYGGASCTKWLCGYRY